MNSESSRPNREVTLEDLADKFDKLNDRINTFDQRFSDYQQATQWVVQLAFALIASSTVTVIVTAIFKAR
jgi:hypothetical protein